MGNRFRATDGRPVLTARSEGCRAEVITKACRKTAGRRMNRCELRLGKPVFAAERSAERRLPGRSTKCEGGPTYAGPAKHSELRLARRDLTGTGEANGDTL